MASAQDLLTVPMKTSYEVVLTDALKALFKECGYTSKDAAVTSGIEEFGKFRSQVISKNLAKTAISLELLYRYHDQLAALHHRLGSKSLHNVTIYWDDALDKGGLFGGKANISTASLDLERICIIFNIAALQTALAKECRTVDTDEELKNAAKYYQSAASIFNHMSDWKPAALEGVVLTQDLKSETLSALSALLLAQAQEVFIDKAIKDKMKESIVAKLCVQAEEMFGDVASKMNKDTIKHLWDRAWVGNVSAKRLGYEALAQYFQSRVCSKQKHYGEEIARLEAFLKGAKKAQEKMGNTSYLSEMITDGEMKLKDARKDNDFIYNEVIPAADNLDAIDRVGSARLAKITQGLPESFSSSFVDLFETAVKKGEGSGDSPSLKSIISTAAGSLGDLLVSKFK